MTTDRYNHILLQKILVVSCLFGFAMSLGGSFFLYIMNFKGIDSLAGVILYSNMIKIGRLLLIIAPAFLFVIDGIKSLFNNREKSKR